MNVKKINFLLLFCLFCFATACDGYISFADELVLPDDELPASNQLALSAMLMNTDTNFYLRTDRAISFQEGYRIDRPAVQISWPIVDENDLDIRLRSNGEDLTTFQHIPEEDRFGSRSVFDTVPWTGPLYPGQVNYRSPQAGTILQPGVTYQLAIDHPRLGEFLIEERMPEKVTEASARVSEVLTNSSNSTYRSVNLTFQDPPGEDNYYFIQVTTDSLGSGLLTLDDTDPRTPEGERLRSSLFFSDSGADGQVIELDFAAFVIFEESVSELTIFSVSEGWYRFMESYQRYFEVAEDLNDGLTEPFQLYSNVPDGFGYFGLGNKVTFGPE